MVYGFERVPDEWHTGEDGHAVPWMVWKLETKLPLLKGNIEFLRRLVEGPVQPLSPPDVPVLVTMAFNGLALRLQAGEGHYLRSWLAGLSRGPASAGFRYPYLDEQVGLEAGRLAARIVARLMSDRFPDADAFLAGAEQLVAGVAKQVVTVAPKDEVARLLIEALSRGVPVRRISTSMPLYRLGQGCRQKSIWRGFTVHTSHIGTVAATRKSVANELLRSVGLPVPGQRQVNDAETARQAAKEIGFPVVVKPASTDYGTAVSVDVRNATELDAAFRSARVHGAVLIEEQLPGADYRLVVVDGRFVSAIRRTPAQVVGDGVSDLKMLVVDLGEVRRADPELAPYGSPSLDDPLVQETLRRQELAGDSIPAEGQIVMLRLNANVSTGGSFVDVTADMHPDNISLAERAAACLGLDHAGIDFITPDITRPWHAINCGICEINPTPGMDVSAMRRLLDYLFPAGSDGRIPVVVVVGEPADASVVVELVQERARATGRVPGVVLGGVATIGGERACRDARPTTALLEVLLADAAVELVVAQVSVDELLRYGLRAPQCDLAVFLTGSEGIQAVTASRRSTVGFARAILPNPTPEALREALLAL